MAQALGRDRSKDFTLDYANQRGFIPNRFDKSVSHLKGTQDRVDFKPVASKQSAHSEKEFEQRMLEKIKRVAELDKKITALKQDSAIGLADQYKQLMVERYQTQDAELHSHYEKKLDKLALSICKKPSHLAKINVTEPKIGRFIQARAQKALGRDQDVER
jgi:hypothetical protein